MKRPNILLIHCHDAGRFIQPYGYPVATPNLQRLAEEGIVFRQAFCAAPTCSPSRAAMLTGQWAHSAGMYGLAHESHGGFRLNDYGRHIAGMLKRSGYATVLCGVQHEAKDAAWLGYDRIEWRQPAGGHTALAVSARAAALLAGRPAEPFFMSAGSVEPHRLMGPGRDPSYFTDPGPSGDSRFVRPPAHLPDTPETRQDMADFYEAVKRFDAGVGVVLDALEKSGLADRTIVVCTTDHGIAFPGMKCTLTDRGLGVFLIVRGPGFAGGRVVDAMVSQIDLMPTLWECAGLERPEWFQGVSLRPLARGEKTEVRDAVFGEVTYHAAYEPQRAVRTARWKYIRRYDEIPPHPAGSGLNREKAPWEKILPNCDPGLTKTLLVRHGWAERREAREQLYDLLFDPQECRNLAGDPTAAPVLDDMRRRLQRWMEETGDPLLTGAVPAPPCPF